MRKPRKPNARRTLLASLAVAVLAGTLVTGCDDGTAGSEPDRTSTATSRASATAPTPTPGLAGLPAETIVTRAEAAFRAARSLRVSGTAVDGKEDVALDLYIHPRGTHGSLAFNGVGTKLILIGKVVYLQPSERLWREEVPKADQEATIKAMRGRWLKAPATDKDFAEFVEFSAIGNVADLIFDATRGSLTKTKPRTIKGVPCIGVTDRHAVLWIDVRNARPVRLEGTDGGGTIALDIGRYDAAPAPKAPPARQVIDVPKLDS